MTADETPAVPSCPVCGRHGDATRVDLPHGRWYCSCGSLFNGTDAEWRRLARHRRMAAERRAGYQQEMPL